MKIAVIGGGAAGCFAAIELKDRLPGADVVVYEAARRPLVKLGLTGGGRCNLTNTFATVRSPQEVYPRGGRLMARLLKAFSSADAVRWFEERGVRCVAQLDECVFPASQDAQQIVNTLLYYMRRARVELKTEHRLVGIERVPMAEEQSGISSPRYSLRFANGAVVSADYVLVATGGCSRATVELLRTAGVDVVEPLPSLFSLRIANASLTALQGTVVEHAVATLCGEKVQGAGPLLVTDWGLRGPAILKLSSRGARLLAEREYRVTIAINWLGSAIDETASQGTPTPATQTTAAEWLRLTALNNPRKQLSSVHPTALNARLWTHLLCRAQLRPEQPWAELGSKGLSRLAQTLTSDTYTTLGRCTHKQEFVTCGGVALTALNGTSLESRALPGVFFAGEVTDVDGLTGGFNLQAAWSMAHAVAEAIAQKNAD